MLFLSIFFLLLAIFFFITSKKKKLPINSILILALITRAIIIILFPYSTSPDLNSFLDAGKIILNKQPVYPSFYFPFFPYLGALALMVEKIINPLLFLKIIFSLFDVLIVYLIFLISNSQIASFFYAVNPVTILTISIHGQFDSIPLSLFLLAIYLLKKQKPIISLFSLSSAIWTKTWPGLFMIPLLKKIKNKRLWLIIPLLPLGFVIFHSLIFNIPILKILLPIKNYRGVYGVWGVGQIIHWLTPGFTENNDPGFIRFYRRLFLISFLLFALFSRPKKIFFYVYQQMLFLFGFTITFGPQWLGWIIPFLLIVQPKHYQFFLTIITLYLLSNFYGDVYPSQDFLETRVFLINTLSLFVWLAVIWFFKKSFKQLNG